MVPSLLLARSDAQPAGYRDISPLAALHHLGELRLIDVREPDEFVGPLGHVPGAELVPLSTIPTAAAGWERSERLLLICRSGGRSARAATTMAGIGFGNLFNLSGGMLAWEANALPRLRDDDTPLARLAGEVHACYVAAAGGDVAGATRAFEAAVGPSACSADALRRAVGALRPTDSASPEECAGWVERLEARLARVG
jgi:rhodanese-related sulfurtransferase